MFNKSGEVTGYGDNFVIIGGIGPTRPRRGESRDRAREAVINYNASTVNACSTGFCQLREISQYGLASLFNTNQA